MKTKIEQLLKSLKNSTEVFEKCNTDELRADLKSNLEAFVKEQMESAPKELKDSAEAVLNVDESITTIEGDFKGWSEFATNVFGEWSKEAAELAVLGILASGGSINLGEQDRVLSYGELLELEESSPLYNHPSKVTVSQKVSGETLEFGVNGEILKEWISMKEGQWDDIALGPVICSKGGPIIEVKKDDTDSWIEQAKILGLTEQEINDVAFYIEMHFNPATPEKVDQFLSIETKLPLVVSDEKLAELYLASEREDIDYLAPLVGIVRSLNISKEDFDKATEIYSTLGKSALKSLLNKAFEAQSDPAPVLKQEINSQTETTDSSDELFDTLGRLKKTSKRIAAN